MPVLGKVGLRNRGSYQSSASYTRMDFVLYNGSTYVALKDISGVTPANDGTNWQFLAQGLSVTLQNNLLTTEEGLYALDAAQGPKILSRMPKLILDDYAAPSVSVETSTNKTLTDFQLPEAGLYLIVATVIFAPNATGVRKAIAAEYEDVFSNAKDWGTAPASGSVHTGATFARIWHAKSATTMHIIAWQNSGATINANYILQVVKIA